MDGVFVECYAEKSDDFIVMFEYMAKILSVFSLAEFAENDDDSISRSTNRSVIPFDP